MHENIGKHIHYAVDVIEQGLHYYECVSSPRCSVDMALDGVRTLTTWVTGADNSKGTAAHRIYVI